MILASSKLFNFPFALSESSAPKHTNDMTPAQWKAELDDLWGPAVLVDRSSVDFIMPLTNLHWGRHYISQQP